MVRLLIVTFFVVTPGPHLEGLLLFGLSLATAPLPLSSTLQILIGDAWVWCLVTTRHFFVHHTLSLSQA
jgi:hypothetical protein